MAKQFSDYINEGRLNLTTTSYSTNLTDHLRAWESVPKYYQGQLDKIRKNQKGALKSIKKLPSGEYQLKIQLGKYAHGLIQNDNEIYQSATFPTKDEAIQAYQNWIDDLVAGDEGIVACVEPAWNDYVIQLQKG